MLLAPQNTLHVSTSKPKFSLFFLALGLAHKGHQALPKDLFGIKERPTLFKSWGIFVEVCIRLDHRCPRPVGSIGIFQRIKNII